MNAPEPTQFGHPSTWPGTSTPQPDAAPPPVPRQTSRTAVLVIVGLVVLVIVGSFAAVRLYNTSRSDPAADTSAQLIATCREGVKARLKAPSTAQFGEETTAGMSETRWKVSGVVDAQNGFGAMLRKRYSCQADKDGSGGWEVFDVAFTDWSG